MTVELNSGKPERRLAQRVIAIGAADGGLEALERFLTAVQEPLRAAVVLIHKMDAQSADVLYDLLPRFTSMPVTKVGQVTPLSADHLYVLPPHHALRIQRDGCLSAVLSSGSGDRSPGIDAAFQTLATRFRDRLIGIILSGPGGDGTLGMKAINESGGMTLAQNIESAQRQEMPRNAAASGCVDHILSPEAMPQELVAYLNHLADEEKSHADVLRQLEHDVRSLIPRICNTLKQSVAHDFRHYKDSTLVRRVQRRIQVLRLTTATEYLDYLRAHEDEVQQLFRELLISVTSFFRDPEAFALLEAEVVPKLFEQQAQDSSESIRVWVPGCATGEEAYSLAMLLFEERERRGSKTEIQIFATDIDERALITARAGVYPVSIAESLTERRLKRFFVKKGRQYHLTKTLRDLCIFSLHNLISDPPYSRMNLVSCRNLLIYLGSHLQQKLIPLFHFALKPQGYLLLGPSENLASHTEIFRTVDKKHRISQRKAGPTEPGSLNFTAHAPRLVSVSGTSSESGEQDIHQVAQRIVLDEFSPRYAVINAEGSLICTSTHLERYIEFPEGPFRNNVLKLARSGLRNAVRSALREAKDELRTITRKDLTLRTEQGVRRVKLVVQPMPEMGEDDHLFMLVFYDLGGLPEKTLLSDDSRVEAVIEHLETELESTRTELERSIQELESSNEELKSSNEELRSLNEEMQSANEELEASKEEIQAGMEALSRAKSDLQCLLDGTEIATIYLDRHGNINSFTPSVTAIYNVKAADVGRPLSDITHSSRDMPPLPDVESESFGSRAVENEVALTDGRWFLRRSLPYRIENRIEGQILTFVDVSEIKRAEIRLGAEHSVTNLLSTAASFAEVDRRVLEEVRACLRADVGLIWMPDAQDMLHCVASVTSDNDERLDAFVQQSQSLPLTVGQGLPGLVRQSMKPEWIEDVQAHEAFVRRSQAAESGLRSGTALPIMSGDECQGVMEFFTRELLRSDPLLDEMLAAIGHQIGLFIRRYQSEESLRDEESRKSAILSSALDCIITMDMQGRIVEFNPAAEATFGWSSAEVQGRVLADVIVPEDLRDAHRQGLNRFLTTGVSSVLGKRIELSGLRSDGTRFPMEIAIHCSQTRGGDPFFTAYLRDITERKQQERRVKESEAFLRHTLDSLMAFVGVCLPDGTLIEANRPVMKVANVDPADVLGKPLWEVFWFAHDPLLQKQLQAAIARAAAGETARFDVQVRITEDEFITVDFQLAPMKNESGEVTHLIPSGIDVSDRKHAEQLILENQLQLMKVLKEAEADRAKFKVIFDQSIYFAGVLDLNGVVLDVNQAALERCGYRAEEILQLPFWETPWWRGSQQVRELIKQAVATASSGEPVQCEITYWISDGSERMVDLMISPARNEAGEIIFLVPTGLDITERKAAESREKREAEIDHFLSDAGAALASSLDYEETLGKVTRLCVPTLADWAFVDLLEEGGSSRRMAIAHSDPSQKELAQQVSRFAARRDWLDHPPSRALFGAQGFVIPDFTEEMLRRAAQNPDHERVLRAVGPKSYVVVPLRTRDTTLGSLTLISTRPDRAYGEQDLRVAEELARRAAIAIDNARLYEEGQKANVAKTEFVANMSHEIRTPMTAVLGYTDLLMAREDDSEKLDFLQTIKRNGRFLLDIINDILDLSKIEAGKMELSRERFPAHSLVADVHSMMQVRAAEKRLPFTVEFAGAIPETIESDPKRLRQILVNLVGNAIKFTDHGEVRLVVRPCEENGSTKLQFDVIDTGIGISESQRSGLFQPFSQGDASVTRNYGGSGLGLAISQRLAEMLGGEITIKSQPGGGSTFTCVISAGDVSQQPRIIPQLAIVNERQMSFVEPQRLQCRVLVVDDRRDVRILAGHFLQKSGAQVEYAEDGVQATERIKNMFEGGAEIDLILLDMQMPRMDGYQTAARLREMGFKNPIIALTADAMHGDMRRCIENGCDAYLSKPIDATELLNLVERYGVR